MEEETDAAVIEASLREPARFGAVFDRHAAVLHRYLVRRLGPHDADSMVGEVFRIAFEKRASYDPGRPSARPWLYGIATNLLAKHRRREARRIQATARLATRRTPPGDFTDRLSDSLDAADRWQQVAAAVTALPQADATRCCCGSGRGSPTRRSPTPSACPSARSAPGSTGHGAGSANSAPAAGR